MPKIFISYSRSDKNIVFALKQEIESVLGQNSCWIDLTGIESDRMFVDVIIDAIDNTEIFLFMYSEHSDKSEWARKEIEYAVSEKKRVVFVRIDRTPLSKYFRFLFGGHDIIDINDDPQKQKLMSNLACWCGLFDTKDSQPPVVNTQEQQELSIGQLWIKFKSHLPEVLIVLSLLNILPIGFIFVNYYFRKQLQVKYPIYWKYLMKVTSNIYKLLYVINFVGAVFLLCIAVFEGYDFWCKTWSLGLLLLNLILLQCGLYKANVIGLRNKKDTFLYLGFSTVSYFVASTLFLILESNHNARMEKISPCEINDTTIVISDKMTDTPNIANIEGNNECSEEIASYLDSNHNARIEKIFPCEIDDTTNVISNKTPDTPNIINIEGHNECTDEIASYQCVLKGFYDNIYSELSLTISPKKFSKIEGHLEETNEHPELYFIMYLHKKALRGVIENADGQNVGNVQGLCNVADSILTIKGKVVLIDESKHYSEHVISYEGISPKALRETQQINKLDVSKRSNECNL